jgi:hypothetical protein
MHVFNNTSNSSDITMIAQLTATAAPVEPVVPGDTVFVDVDSNTMYIEPLEDLPNSGNPQGWTATVYDLTQDNGKGDPDTNPNWAAGQHGVGMADGDDNTQIPDDDDTYGIYTRTEFTVDDASLVVGMQIAVDYDDSYIMYINGTEVSRAAEAGSGVDAWNLLGSCKCDSSENGTLEPPISLDAHIPLLVDGTNILAIHVFNNSQTSSDLTMIAQLTADVDPAPPAPVVPGDTVLVDVDSATMYIEPLEDLPNSGNPQGWTATDYDLTQDDGKGDHDNASPNWAAGQHGVGMADGDDNTQYPTTTILMAFIREPTSLLLTQTLSRDCRSRSILTMATLCI